MSKLWESTMNLVGVSIHEATIRRANHSCNAADLFRHANGLFWHSLVLPHGARELSLDETRGQTIDSDSIYSKLILHPLDHVL